MAIRDRLIAWLDDTGVPWQRLNHARTTTAVEAAEQRGTPLEIGGKTLVFKAAGRFVLMVVPGHARIDNRAFRHALGVQRYRFANREELRTHIGLEPGCIPPFGEPLFDLPLYVDESFTRQERIAFTLADHTSSGVLAMSDYLRIARPLKIVPVASMVKP